MNIWKAWGEKWPDWSDAGRLVQTYDDGIIFSGKLVIDDVVFDGEDEYPILVVESDKGRVSFAECEYWRFLN